MESQSRIQECFDIVDISERKHAPVDTLQTFQGNLARRISAAHGINDQPLKAFARPGNIFHLLHRHRRHDDAAPLATPDEPKQFKPVQCLA